MQKKIKILAALLVLLTVSSCAHKYTFPYKVCVLDMDRNISKCQGAGEPFNLHNQMMNGYVCMEADSHENYVMGCEENRKALEAFQADQ